MIKAQATMLYTKEHLFEDILKRLESMHETSERGWANRNFVNEQKVFQTVFCMQLPQYDFEKDNLDEIKEAIELSVHGDELLFGYTYFLSSNTNFDYSWSYLRKQIDKYIDFLSEVYRFISFAIKDINVLSTNLDGDKRLHVEFNKIFDVAFSDEAPFIQTEVYCENFHQINSVKSGYYMSFKIEQTTLLTFYRKYNDNLNSYIGRVKHLLSEWEEQEKK